MNSLNHKSLAGFTLVELLVTMAISMIIGLTLVTAYRFQQDSQITQDQVVEIQQNIRSALHFMSREIRMAGFDPQQTSDAGILIATNSQIQFSQDINVPAGASTYPGDGDTNDPGETITFGFTNAVDADGDGVADAGAATLSRGTGAAPIFQPLADNITAIEFLYTLEGNPTPTLNPAAGELDDIRKVTVSLLARARLPDPDHLNNTIYVSASGANWPVNDNFRRRLLVTDISLRNMGLK